ncbi:MAG: FtsW/RodA/SpoVE family cell cycle protein [Thomasclavelia sp.]|nr:FtsW/RodA/SpoVE family cell cycle protein [Thomasclavelia sp.]
MNSISSFIKRLFTRKGSDLVLYLATFTLVATGIVMIGSASIGSVTDNGTGWALTNMIKQLIFVVVGIIAMVLVQRFFRPKQLNIRVCKILYIVFLGMMAICIAFTSANGSHAWIRLGSITIQPAEFMKIIMILILAYYLSDTDGAYPKLDSYGSREKKQEYYKIKFRECLLWPFMMLAIACIVGIAIQKDFGTTVILAVIGVVIFFSTPRTYYTKYKKVAAFLLGVGFILAVFLATFILKDYQLSRIYGWLDPLRDYYDSTYQLANALIAFTNGHIFGLGLGNSTQKFGYIPEAHNDFIGAIIYEELGIFGLALMIIPTCIIIFKFLNYAYKVKSSKERLILIGLATYFFLHLFINLGGVSGLIPMTGVPLLLISSGGSSTVAALCAVGLGQNIISRYNKAKLREQQTSDFTM